MDATFPKPRGRRIIWHNVLTVISAAILIGAEVFGAAFAAGCHAHHAPRSSPHRFAGAGSLILRGVHAHAHGPIVLDLDHHGYAHFGFLLCLAFVDLGTARFCARLIRPGT